MPEVSASPSPSESTQYRLSYGDSFREQLAELEKGDAAAYIQIMKHTMDLENIPRPENARTLSVIEHIMVQKLIIPKFKKAVLYQIDTNNYLISILDVVNAIAV